MTRKKVLVLIGIAATLVVALTLVAGAVVTTTIANAKGASRLELFQDDGETAQPGAPMGHGGRGGPGRPGFAGKDANGEYLAQALGISVEELEAAIAEANDAALDQAVANGDLTQEQADAIRTLRQSGEGMGRGFGHHFGFGADVDYEALLADALGISVDELQAARQEAHDLAIQAAVEAGDLTQEQADMMAAMAALKGAIDPQAITAQVLGISVEELEELRGERGAMSDLLEEKGLTQEEFRAQMQAAYEAAVAQAVEDGVITQEQADQILAGEAGFGRGFMPGGRGGHGGRGPCAPGELNPDSTNPQAPAAPSDGSTGTGA